MSDERKSFCNTITQPCYNCVQRSSPIPWAGRQDCTNYARSWTKQPGIVTRGSNSIIKPHLKTYLYTASDQIPVLEWPGNKAWLPQLQSESSSRSECRFRYTFWGFIQCNVSCREFWECFGDHLWSFEGVYLQYASLKLMPRFANLKFRRWSGLPL